MAHQPPHRGGGIDALVEHHQVHLAALQVAGEVDEVRQRAAEPVKPGDHELVAGTGNHESVVELEAAGELAAGGVEKDPLAASGVECPMLSVEVLVARGDPPVADPHAEGPYRKRGCA